MWSLHCRVYLWTTSIGWIMYPALKPAYSKEFHFELLLFNACSLKNLWAKLNERPSGSHKCEARETILLYFTTIKERHISFINFFTNLLHYYYTILSVGQKHTMILLLMFSCFQEYLLDILNFQKNWQFSNFSSYNFTWFDQSSPTCITKPRVVMFCIIMFFLLIKFYKNISYKKK